MQCSNCGEHSESARFCPNCGTPLGTHVVYVHNRSSGLHLLMHSTGASRVLLIIGLLLGLTGFAMFAFAGVDFIVQGFQGTQAGNLDPPDTSRVAFWMPVGFGFALVGTVFWVFGVILFRSRRK